MNNETMKIIRTRVGGFRADLEVLGPPQVVAALIAQIHAFAQATLATIADLKNELSAEYAAEHSKWNGAEPENRTPVEDSPWTGTLHAAGIASVVLEACFAAILAALTFNMPIIAAAAVGVLMTVAITLIFKASWRVFTSDEGRPRKGAKALAKQLLIVFPMWLLCLTGALLLGRTLTEATPFTNVVFGSLMTALTILSPALAAILLTLSELRGWQRKHVRQWRNLEKLKMEVHELEEYAAAVEGRLSGEPQKKQQSPRGASAGLTVTAAALLLLVCSVNVSGAECRNQIWIDYTNSVSPVERQAVFTRSLALLPSFAESECGREWELFGFAGAAISETAFYTIRLPRRPTGTCPVQAHVSEVAKWFRGPAQAAEAERQQACDKMRQAANEIYHAAIEAQTTQAREKAAAFQVLDSGKTCILDLLYRLSDTRDTIKRSLILTDGGENCTTSFRGPLAPPGTHTVVAMVIVSQQNPKPPATPGQYYIRMRDRWLKIVPWINVYAPYGVNAKDLGSVFGLAADGVGAGVSR